MQADETPNSAKFLFLLVLCILQLQADEAIDFLMKQICSENFTNLDLPEADQNRHNVVNDRMCLCQLYERDNPLG